MKIVSDPSTPLNPEVLMNDVLARPLFAHLSTMHNDGPRESPVWFLWKEEYVWILGNTLTDSFLTRIKQDSRCALGVVDFQPSNGLVYHVGFRGHGHVRAHDRERITALFRKYMGDQEHWDPRFAAVLGDPNWEVICIQPDTAVVRDQSYSLHDHS